MTAMNLHLLFRADTAAARKGTAEIKAELDALKAKAGQSGAAMSSSMRGAAEGASDLAGAVGEIGRGGAGLAPLPGQLQATGTSAGMAAGGVGNLVAQFNDIGMMLAAGQNPLMLAIQQGTSITQVIGPMGAAGAAKALGAAFLSMMSPLNLATLGVIALGATATQWLMGAGEEALTLSERVDGLTDAFDAYRASAAIANLATGEAAAKFGFAADKAARYHEVLAGINGMRLDQQFAGAGQGMLDQIGANMDARANEIGNLTGASQFFGLGDNVMFGEGARQLRSELIPLIQSLQDFRDATNVEDRIVALETALARAAELAQQDGKVGQGKGSEQELLDSMTATLDVLTQLRTEEQQVQQSRAQMAQEYGGILRQQWAERAQFANDEIGRLNEEAAMKQLVARWGEDSLIVTRARVQAERDAYAELVASEVGANALADGMMAAWDNANGVASVDVQGNIALAEGATWSWADAMGAVGAEISGILSALSSLGGGMIGNAAKFVEINALKAGKSVAEAERARREFQIDNEFDAREASAGNFAERMLIRAERLVATRGLDLDAELGNLRADANERDRAARRGSSGGGRGGGGAAMNEDLREAQRLFDATRTDAEKYEAELARIEELYAKGAISQETHARAIEMIGEKYLGTTNAAKALAEWNGQIKDAIIDMATGGVDSFGRLEEAMKRALAQALLFGEGPLSGFLGFDGGGLLGSIFKTDLPAKADGGLLTGPGTGRSDSILLRASNGEYIVNAAATAKHRPLLEAINAGTLPAFANGGLIGTPRLLRQGANAGGADQAARRAVFEINVSGTGNSEIRAGVHEAIRAAFDEYSNRQLPGLVRMIQTDRWGD